MRINQGFTLIELLLALSLGSFVILGMMETYRGVIRYLERSRSMMETNRKVCLLFNQVERDFSTAYIPNLYDEVKPLKEAGTDGQEAAKPDNDKDKKKVTAAKKRRQKTFFMASIDDQADLVKIDGKRKKLFKKATFICSHPFQVYGQKQVRLVRVGYQLIKDKAASKGGPIVYQLWRKETTNLLNTRLKEDEQVGRKKAVSVKKYMVADNIKSMVVEFMIFKKEDEKKKIKSGRKKPPQEISFLTWSDKKETAGVVPRKVRVWIDFWNDRKTSQIRFHGLFPIFSYPTEIKDDKKKEKQEVGAQKKDERSKQVQPQSNQGGLGQAEQGGQQEAGQPAGQQAGEGQGGAQ